MIDCKSILVDICVHDWKTKKIILRNSFYTSSDETIATCPKIFVSCIDNGIMGMNYSYINELDILRINLDVKREVIQDLKKAIKSQINLICVMGEGAIDE